MTRAEWFMALAALAYPAGPDRAQNAMAPYVPWLTDLPDAAFTRASLDAVINSPRKMAIPSYDEIRRPLSAWWRDNRPAEQRLASEYPALQAPTKRPGPPTEIEREAVANLVGAFKAEIAAKSSVRQIDEAERPTPRYLADHQLLAQYEATANNALLPRAMRDIAQTRVDMLRRSLGLDREEMRHAAD